MSNNNTSKPTISTAGHKKRKCLKCGNQFDSTGPGNRVCPKCTPAGKYGKQCKDATKEFKFR